MKLQQFALAKPAPVRKSFATWAARCPNLELCGSTVFLTVSSSPKFSKLSCYSMLT